MAASERTLIEIWNKGTEAFNNGDFFVAHEWWEKLWKQSSGEEKSYLQALIQACGVLVHIEKENPSPAFKLAQLSLNKLNIDIDSPYKITGLREFLTLVINSEDSWSDLKIQKVKMALKAIPRP